MSKRTDLFAGQPPASPAAPDREPEAAAAGSSGYSLLEIVIALAIVGLALALTAPNLRAMHQGAERRAALQDVARQLVDLRAEAYLSGEALLLESPAQRAYGPGRAAPPGLRLAALELAEGWRFAAEPAIVFEPTGLCSGGLVRLYPPDDAEPMDLELTSPDCRLER